MCVYGPSIVSVVIVVIVSVVIVPLCQGVLYLYTSLIAHLHIEDRNIHTKR